MVLVIYYSARTLEMFENAVEEGAIEGTRKCMNEPVNTSGELRK